MQRRVAGPISRRVAACAAAAPQLVGRTCRFQRDVVAEPLRLLVRVGMTADIDEQRGVVDVGTLLGRRGRCRSARRSAIKRCLNSCSIGGPSRNRCRARVPRRAPRVEMKHGRGRPSSAKPMPRFETIQDAFAARGNAKTTRAPPPVRDSAQILPPGLQRVRVRLRARGRRHRRRSGLWHCRLSRSRRRSGCPQEVRRRCPRPQFARSHRPPTITAIGSDHRARAVSAANPARPQRPRPRSRISLHYVVVRDNDLRSRK